MAHNRHITTDTTLNKGASICVRLTPHQDYELKQIAQRHKVKVSGLIRGLVDRLIDASTAGAP